MKKKRLKYLPLSFVVKLREPFHFAHNYVTFFKSDIWNGLSLGTYLVPNSKSKNGLRKRKWTLVIIGWCAQCLTSKLVQSMHVSIFSVSVHYKIV